MMKLQEFFPVWDQIAPNDRLELQRAATMRRAPKGEQLHRGSENCEGLFCVVSGRLRAYITSEEGREITLYRLSKGEVCLFSASCMLSAIRFEVFVETEQDSDLLVIPAGAYRQVMERSAALANYTNQLMASRFTEVMWLIEQILWKSLDRRLASFLLAESAAEETGDLLITHEKIADHLGTAREVVTRMLRYFQSEGLVALSRGRITLKDRARLALLAS